MYLAGLAPVLALDTFAPVIPRLQALPFLPLMVISVYCAVGILLVWLHLNYLTWARPELVAVAPSRTKPKRH